MTNRLKSPLNEGATFNITCRTGSANPPVAILWFQANNPIYEQVVDEEGPGDHGGIVTVSTVTVMARRDLNLQQYKCCLNYTIAYCTPLILLDIKGEYLHYMLDKIQL